LPARRRQLEGYEFYDMYEAANQIGGDYFDYVLLPDGKMRLFSATCRKRNAAALLMAKLSATSAIR